MVERAKKTVLFPLLFPPLMKPHTVGGETFGDQKRHRLVCGKLLEKDDPARITQKLRSLLLPWW